MVGCRRALPNLENLQAVEGRAKQSTRCQGEALQ